MSAMFDDDCENLFNIIQHTRLMSSSQVLQGMLIAFLHKSFVSELDMKTAN